ncbi:unnamed protein product, partial [Musa textilis]
MDWYCRPKSAIATSISMVSVIMNGCSMPPYLNPSSSW